MHDRDLFEGDILTSPTVGASRAGRLPWWPGFVVPYTLDSDLPHPERVGEAMEHWQSTSRFRFIKRTARNAADHPDWVHILSDRRSAAHLGRRGGRQQVTLAPGATLGNAIHELGHAVGFWHEPAVEDRDAFVTTHWATEQTLRARLANEQLCDSAEAEHSDYARIMQQPHAGMPGPAHWSRATSVLVPAGGCWTLEA